MKIWQCAQCRMATEDCNIQCQMITADDIDMTKVTSCEHLPYGNGSGGYIVKWEPINKDDLLEIPDSLLFNKKGKQYWEEIDKC